MTSPLKRQNAHLNLWETVKYPVLIYERECEVCRKSRTVEFNYNRDSSIRTVYACSLTCFNELQKGKK